MNAHPALPGRTEICADPRDMALRASAWIADEITASKSRFRLALAGGSTPKPVYAQLASDRARETIDWKRVEFYWGDERFVPPNHPDSNSRMVREALLSHISVPARNVFPISTDGNPDDAARRYEKILKTQYGADLLDPARPLFDLVLLGLGSDGHICSLLPGSPALDERKRWVVAVSHGRPEPRITLTFPAIESSRAIVFLIAGKEKAAALRAVREGDRTMPAARLAPRGEVIWFIDRAAQGD